MKMIMLNMTLKAKITGKSDLRYEKKLSSKPLKLW